MEKIEDMLYEVPKPKRIQFVEELFIKQEPLIVRINIDAIRTVKQSPVKRDVLDGKSFEDELLNERNGSVKEKRKKREKRERKKEKEKTSNQLPKLTLSLTLNSLSSETNEKTERKEKRETKRRENGERKIKSEKRVKSEKREKSEKSGNIEKIEKTVKIEKERTPSPIISPETGLFDNYGEMDIDTDMDTEIDINVGFDDYVDTETDTEIEYNIPRIDKVAGDLKRSADINGNGAYYVCSCLHYCKIASMYQQDNHQLEANRQLDQILKFCAKVSAKIRTESCLKMIKMISVYCGATRLEFSISNLENTFIFGNAATVQTYSHLSTYSTIIFDCLDNNDLDFSFSTSDNLLNLNLEELIEYVKTQIPEIRNIPNSKI